MKKYTDIKTFEDACAYLKLDSSKVVPSFEYFPKDDKESMIAHCKLILIVKAINKLDDDYTPNWNNNQEYKYYPWFNISSLVFSYHASDFWSTYSTVGSRLCFRTSEIAEYTGKQFLGLYKSYFVKDIEIKEVTIEDIQKIYGCKIKIIETKK